MRLDRRERFSVTNCFKDSEDRKTAREPEKAKLIMRRHFATTSDQRDQPAVVFDFEKYGAAFLIRRRSLHVGALPIAFAVLGNGIERARISKLGVNHDLFGRLVSKLFEPSWRL